MLLNINKWIVSALSPILASESTDSNRPFLRSLIIFSATSDEKFESLVISDTEPWLIVLSIKKM